MDKAQAARRLSAALGREIKASSIERVTVEGMVRLEDGTLYQLFGSNSCFVGSTTDARGDLSKSPHYMRNGKAWDPGPNEEGVRPLHKG